MPPRRKDPRAGFTIVELLVVIAVIAILLGIMLVGLQGASRTSKNLRSMNRGRQVFIAWTAYSNTYADKLLPGYLSTSVQDKWRVTYSSPSLQGSLDSDFTETYPLRLLPYLDNSVEPMFGYRNDVDSLQNEYASENNPAEHEAALQVMADTPEFGYNAYYVGGWWKMSDTRAHLIFGDTPIQANGSGGSTRNVRGRLVALNLGSIRQPERLVTFCTASFRDQGIYVRNERNPDGAAWVVPPRLCETEVWNSYAGNPIEMGATVTPALASQGASGQGLEVFTAEAVPLRRHGITVPTVTADGATAQLGIPDLLDMTRWTSGAITSIDGPLDFSHECDPVLADSELGTGGS